MRDAFGASTGCRPPPSPNRPGRRAAAPPSRAANDSTGTFLADPDHERQVLQAIRDPVFRTLQVTVH